MARLIHYREHPFDYDPTVVYIQTPPHGHHKPEGLWVSVESEDDWKSWCEAEEFNLDGLTHAYQVTLAPEANLLHISTGEALDAFHAAHAVQTEFEARMANVHWPHRSPLDEAFLRRQWPVDWRPITTAYDGLVCAPYLHDHHLFGPNWYNVWDCASGVIWHLSAIDSVEKVNEPEGGQVLCW